MRGRTYGKTEIAELRRNLGLSQAEFAEKFHLKPRTVQAWEGGTEGNCPEATLWMIRRILELEARVGELEGRAHGRGR